MQLKSTPGIGTTFKVHFPVQQPSDYAEMTVPLASSEKTDGTILLVEDEETLLAMGSALLEGMGFSVLSAQHGQKALEIYRERGSDIDVILMDLIMPVMGGIETYHELRKTAPTLPIIICSGYSAESVKEIIENDEKAEFVQKPYKPAALRDMMIRMMAE